MVAVLIFGIFMLLAAVMGNFGTYVSQHEPALMMYVIGAIAVAYLLPIVLATVKCIQAEEKKVITFFWWLIGWLFLTSAFFAMPSSFVADDGCKAGNQTAAWAMKAIPLLYITEAVTRPGLESFTCMNGGIEVG